MAASTPRISVAIITKNEAADIGDCLASVAGWTFEVVVVDSGSTDGTQDICRAAGATVIETADWPGFGVQKNRAVAACGGDWVLSLDADEQVGPALRDEILQAVKADAPVAYRMPRLSQFCGREMHHSGWWPDYVLRLFKRGHGRFSDDRVHERVLVDAAVGTLQAPLLHRAIVEIDESLTKVNRYSTDGAQAAAARGKRGSFGRAIASGLWTFLRVYFLRRGFLDGKHGFMLAVLNAEGSYYRHLKLWLMQMRDEGGR
jgi:glycosyltransferase involved in cell wall biosynthesis